MFIVFEGVDGSGKGTQIDLTCKRLSDLGLSFSLFREPGGTEIGEEVRRLLLSNDSNIEDITEVLLYTASRSQLVKEKILPSLDRGEIVVLDRYYYSNIAYQGYGLELNPQWIEMLNMWVVGELKPDVIFYLDITAEQSKARMSGNLLDRMESRDIDYFKRVRKGYLTIADSTPEMVILDGMDNIDSIDENIWLVLRELLLRRGFNESTIGSIGDM